MTKNRQSWKTSPPDFNGISSIYYILLDIIKNYLYSSKYNWINIRTLLQFKDN